MASTILSGITWDHPRGYDSLVIPLDDFHRSRPDIEVRWHRRTLREFGEAPLEVLAERYDLVMIDHPFCGRAAASGCLRDLGPLLPPGRWEGLVADSVGPSTVSYQHAGGTWALPTDAAAQVACWREDLLQAWSLEVPRTWTDTLRLARALRARGAWMALPCVPIDAVCTFLTLLANAGAPLREWAPDLPDAAACEEALGRLRELIALSHPDSLRWNPILAYEAMSRRDEVAFVPMAFGYSNYAREGAARRLRFGPIAGPGPDPQAGSILGGAGCAITRSCKDMEAALRYLEFVHDPSHQRGAYFDAGGQPGSRAAWTDERTNRLSLGYFRDTLPCLDKAYLRPRFDGFIPFFEEAGHTLWRFLHERQGCAAPLARLRSLYRQSLEAGTRSV